MPKLICLNPVGQQHVKVFVISSSRKRRSLLHINAKDLSHIFPLHTTLQRERHPGRKKGWPKNMPSPLGFRLPFREKCRHLSYLFRFHLEIPVWPSHCVIATSQCMELSRKELLLLQLSSAKLSPCCNELLSGIEICRIRRQKLCSGGVAACLLFKRKWINQLINN